MPIAKPDLHIVGNDHLDNIPEELRQLDSWIVWKNFKKSDGEITKPPFDYRTGRIAKNGIHTEKAHMSFDEVEEVLASCKHNFDGIGLVLREGYGLVGYDADHCIDKDGNIDPVVQSDIDALDSYTEISPSGEGIRIFVYGKKPGSNENNGKGFEMYDETSTRYLTLTGNSIEGSPTIVNTSSQGVIDAIYTRIFAEDLKVAASDVRAATGGFPEGTEDAPDVDKYMAKFQDWDTKTSLERLLGDEGFTKLWKERNGKDDSERDYGLINKVVYILQAELKSLYREAQIDRIERVIRRSDIVRDKWDEPRVGVPWIQYEIRSALDTFNVYSRESPRVELDLDEIENLTQAQAKALRKTLAPEEAGTTVLTRLESRGDEVDDLVDELFCGVGVSSVIGQPGDGKTTFVVAMCEKICTQQKQFLGRNIVSPDPDRPVAVFYVAAEAARGVEKRWLANLKADGLNPDDFDRFFQVRTNPAWMHDEEELLKVCSMILLYERAEGVKVVAVIFDTFRANAKEGTKENDNNDMARAIKNVERKISDRLNCNSIIIHHMPKGNVVDAVGGGAYKAGLDQMMAIQPASRVKDADGEYTATFRVKGVKNRDDAPEMMNLNFKLKGIPIGLYKKSGKELTGAYILPIGDDEIKQTSTQLVHKKRRKQTLGLLAKKDYPNVKSLANDLDLKDTRKVSVTLTELSDEGLVKYSPQGRGKPATSSITAKGRESLIPKTDFEIEAGIGD